MNRTGRVNLLLLAILLAGGGGLWWQDQQEQNKLAEEKAGRRIGQLERAAIQKIRFLDGKGSETLLERRGEQWNITQPVAVRTDQGAVTKILDLLDKTYERKAAEGVSQPKDFGLGPELPALILETTDGRKQHVQAGADAPVGATRYLLLNDKGPVVLAARSDLTNLPRDGDALRDKRLFNGITAQNTLNVTITRKQNALTLHRDEQDNWNLDAPWSDAAEGARVDSWLEMIATTTGSGFVKAAPPAQPEWVLTLTTKEKSEAAVSIWRQDNDVIAQRPGDPDAMRLYAFIGKELDKQAEELVSLQPLTTAPPTRLELRMRGQTLTAEKKDGNWASPPWTTLENTLTSKARSGVTPSDRGEPLLTLVAGPSDQAEPFLFWKDDKSYVLAPPGRPVHLRLTPLQSEALDDALKELMPEEESAEKK